MEMAQSDDLAPVPIPATHTRKIKDAVLAAAKRQGPDNPRDPVIRSARHRTATFPSISTTPVDMST